MSKKSMGRQARDLEEKKAKNNPGYVPSVDPVGDMAREQLSKIVEKDVNIQTQVANLVGDAANTIWDDLRSLSLEYTKLFVGMGEIGAVMNNPELLSFVVDRRDFIAKVTLINSDLAFLKKDFLAIRDMHIHKTGGHLDGTDMMEALKINEHYERWVSNFHANIDPTMNEVRAMVAQAEGRMVNSRAKAAEAEQAVAADAPINSEQVIVDADQLIADTRAEEEQAVAEIHEIDADIPTETASATAVVTQE